MKRAVLCVLAFMLVLALVRRGRCFGTKENLPHALLGQPRRRLLPPRRGHGRYHRKNRGRFPLRIGIDRRLRREQPPRRKRRIGHGDGDGQHRLQRHAGQGPLQGEASSRGPFPDVPCTGTHRDDETIGDQVHQGFEGKEGIHRRPRERLCQHGQDHPRGARLHAQQGHHHRQSLAE